MSPVVNIVRKLASAVRLQFRASLWGRGRSMSQSLLGELLCLTAGEVY